MYEYRYVVALSLKTAEYLEADSTVFLSERIFLI